jgi:hypothetical protein
MRSKSSQSGASQRDYRAGDVYSFRTSPATEVSPKETGRYAALKVLGQKIGLVCYVVLDGVFDRHPGLSDVSHLPHLRNSKFAHKGNPASCFVRLGWENNLEDLRYVGTVLLTKEDADALASCRSIGPWSTASSHAEGEWRWRNDRRAYQEEVERSEKARDSRRSAEHERRNDRLKTLTWETLLSEQPFSRWNEHPPYPPAEFVTAANERVLSAIRELRALGQRPKKGQVRAALKALVEWFNEKDAEFGEVIETEEREDIYRVLEEPATVAGQASLVGEIDEWRLW